MVNAGIKGFKCFLVHSGVDEFPCVTENDVRLAMQQMQGTDAVFLVCLILYIHSQNFTAKLCRWVNCRGNLCCNISVQVHENMLIILIRLLTSSFCSIFEILY